VTSIGITISIDHPHRDEIVRLASIDAEEAFDLVLQRLVGADLNEDELRSFRKLRGPPQAREYRGTWAHRGISAEGWKRDLGIESFVVGELTWCVSSSPAGMAFRSGLAFVTKFRQRAQRPSHGRSQSQVELEDTGSALACATAATVRRALHVGTRELVVAHVATTDVEQHVLTSHDFVDGIFPINRREFRNRSFVCIVSSRIDEPYELAGLLSPASAEPGTSGHLDH
jgi:hypothetical protein